MVELEGLRSITNYELRIADSKVIPAIADKIITTYLREIDNSLPGFLNAFYIFGSIPLDDFHPSKSDIDFIAVTSQPPSVTQVKILGNIHRKIQGLFLKPNMNGTYITLQDLGKYKSLIPPVPYFYNGNMHRSGHFEINMVTWFQLINNPVKIRENVPLNFSVNVHVLLKEMHQNMNSYWRNWINEHLNFISYNGLQMFFDCVIEWGVLGVSRQFFTIKTNQITSKHKAGVYCLDNVPAKYNNILSEALRIRREEKRSLYGSKLKRKQDALDYMNYIIDESNKIYLQNNNI